MTRINKPNLVKSVKRDVHPGYSNHSMLIIETGHAANAHHNPMCSTMQTACTLKLTRFSANKHETRAMLMSEVRLFCVVHFTMTCRHWLMIRCPSWLSNIGKEAKPHPTHVRRYLLPCMTNCPSLSIRQSCHWIRSIIEVTGGGLGDLGADPVWRKSCTLSWYDGTYHSDHNDAIIMTMSLFLIE